MNTRFLYLLKLHSLRLPLKYKLRKDMLDVVTTEKNSLCIQVTQLGPFHLNLFLKRVNDLLMVNSAKSWELSLYIQYPKNLNQSQQRRPGSHLSHHRVSSSLQLIVIHLVAAVNRDHSEKLNLILYPEAKNQRKLSLKVNRKRDEEEIVLKSRRLERGH